MLSSFLSGFKVRSFTGLLVLISICAPNVLCVTNTGSSVFKSGLDLYVGPGGTCSCPEPKADPQGRSAVCHNGNTYPDLCHLLCFAHAGEAYLPGPCSQDYKAYLPSNVTISNKTFVPTPSGRCLIQGPIVVPDGTKLPKIDRITLRPGQAVSMIIQPAVIEFYNKSTTTNEDVLQLSFMAPVYAVNRFCAPVLRPPAIIVPTCSSFRINLQNLLPFQEYDTCTDSPDLSNIINGPHNIDWTNLHTHGFKVNPGAVDVNLSQSVGNFCDNPTLTHFTRQDYYCNSTVDITSTCPAIGDNVFLLDRPDTMPMPNIRQGASIAYDYPTTEGIVPGVGWYHGHVHGSVGSQVPTASGPLIVPESSLKRGLSQLYRPLSPETAIQCNALIQILKSQPMESATILQINGIWFRNTTDATPDDDTLPSLGSRAVPQSILLFKDNTTNFTDPNAALYTNNAGRDWFTINGVFQPTISITANAPTRWEVLNTITMKWIDLTVRHVNGSLATTCNFWLLGKDAVPLPEIPRLTRSTNPITGESASDLILTPGTRMDVLIQCTVPGEYVLVSGAGPFFTNTSACQATHCELVGGPPVNNASDLLSQNNIFRGEERPDFAVLAVLKVKRSSTQIWPGQDKPFPGQDHLAEGPLLGQQDRLGRLHGQDLGSLPDDPVCETLLDQFYYLNYKKFPPVVPETGNQCFSFMNQMYGAQCVLNSCIFPNFAACIDQGSTQNWRLRDTTFHPFHLHETPVRITSLPRCSSEVTNMWQVGDWHDIIHIPVCQTLPDTCPNFWPVGELGQPVNSCEDGCCDEVGVQFLATNFSDPTGFVSNRDNCRGAPGRGKSSQVHKAVDRWAVAHCHILPHEDEGCVMPVVWKAPTPSGQPQCTAERVGVCPEYYGFAEGIPNADICNLKQPLGLFAPPP